jgi:arylsulfatase
MSKKAPNVLFICTDQQRFDTLGCYSNPYIDTPNLDRLAQRGVLFERAYCQCPVCTPSRASFLTGRYPRTTRCRQNGQMIPTDERLITRTLADNGYYCGLSGKLHLAPCAPDICQISEARIDDGFHEFHWSHHPAGIGTAGIPESGGCNWPGNEYARWLFENNVLFERKDYDKNGYVQVGVPEEYHQTKWCMDKAIEWINYSCADQNKIPWFYIVNMFDPHHSFDPPQKLLEKYIDRMEKLPLPFYKEGELQNKPSFQRIDHAGAYNVKDSYAFDKMSDYEHRLVKASYYAMIELIDTQVGRAIECLEKNGILENTIIIFTSDHGEMLGDHGIYLKGPYFYEAMVHVPLIISWEGHIPGGRRLNALTELTDLVPTISEYCIGTIEPGVQGKSLAKLLSGEGADDEHRDSVYCEYYNAMPWHDNPKANATMVFDGQYKLCRYHSSDEGELYDLTQDPGEINNLWNDQRYTDIKNKMLIKLADRMSHTVDPLPERIAKW